MKSLHASSARACARVFEKIGGMSRGPTSCYWNLKSEGLWKFKIYNNNKELNTENTIAGKNGIITVTNRYACAPASKERPLLPQVNLLFRFSVTGNTAGLR